MKKRKSCTLSPRYSEKFFFLIRQQFYCTVTDIDQVDQHLDPFVAPHHVAAKRPEGFLLVITDFNIPPERVQEQRDILQPLPSGMVQQFFFLQCAGNLQFFREQRAEKQSPCRAFLSRSCDISQYFPASEKLCKYPAYTNVVATNFFIGKGKIILQRKLATMLCRAATPPGTLRCKVVKGRV